ncbi:MAG: phosphate ABC transporter permease subunit PstC [Candidatus Firestonebacteria bacterium]|nr:phosphate ABC transporter permease subunit PstC [Candidatus Firestonebacteria bacterium]
MLIKNKLITYSIYEIAYSAISILVLITIFIFKEGLPLIIKIGIPNFILSKTWNPLHQQYGIFTMIVGSIWITIGAIIVGVPLGISCSIYIVEYSPKMFGKILKPMLELLAGIPSVVYGFMGVVILTPLIRQYFGGPGLSVLAGAIILGIMILPTVVGISIDALQAVPKAYREGALALGATHWQMIYKVVLPAAKQGIIASVILAIGRAIGETMAVIMVTGNAVKIPHSILDTTRTLTANIALEMGYATGDHARALFATGIVLFIFIMIINIITNLTKGKYNKSS